MVNLTKMGDIRITQVSITVEVKNITNFIKKTLQ